MAFKSLADYRKRAGLTQKQVGDHIGISSQAVSKWETGQSEPDIDTLCKLAKLYNISIEELLGSGTDTQTGNDNKGRQVNKKKIIIISAIAVAIVALIVAAIIIIPRLVEDAEDENILEQYDKIELGMTREEVEEILGEPEDTHSEHIEDEDWMDKVLALSRYGYADADFIYYRGKEYDENLEADENFDLDYELQTYYQIRVTFDTEGKVIECYLNTVTNYFAIDDYGGTDKVVSTLELLDNGTAKITFEDGSKYLGGYEIETENGTEYIDHPWGEIEVE